MFQPLDREEVLRVIRMYGPLLPLQVRQKLGKGETTLIGATLSELAHHGKVGISKVKRGSSPFYYDPNNPASLEKVSVNLGEKDQRAFERLKKERLIRADKLDPLTRVSLAQIKDYAFPIEVEHNGERILFYRYFLLPETEAEQRIRDILEPPEKPKPAAEQPTSAQSTSERPKPAPTIAPPTPTQKTTPKPNPSKPRRTKSAKVGQQKLVATPADNAIETDDAFFKRILRFCNKKGILIKDYAILRKQSEIDLVMVMPTAMGKVEYYCKAKSKKKSNDGDIAGALLAGQLRRLPTIYLTTGDVTKKAKDMTQKELKGVLIKEIKP